MKTKKSAPTKYEWKPAAPAPLTAEELNRLSERAIDQFNKIDKAKPYAGLQATSLYRLAMDANHLALLMDKAAGQKRFDMWVKVTTKAAPKKKARASHPKRDIR